jgi:DNA-binding transcriptional LysR family regulator
MIKEFSGDFFQWIRGFFYVAKNSSVTNAVFEMGRQQPTISHYIRNLEKEFGIQLFEYTEKGMKLTPEGKILFDHVITIFDTVKKLDNSIIKRKNAPSGTIRIATSHALIDYYLSNNIVNFKKQYPNVNFELRGGMLDSIEESVRSGWADFGIAYIGNTMQDMNLIEAFETSMSLIVPFSNSFDIKGIPNLKKITECPFLYYPPSSSLKLLVDKIFSENALQLKPVLVLNHIESNKVFTELGLGISLIYNYAFKKNDITRFNIIPMDKYIYPIKTHIILRKNKYITPECKLFLHHLHNYEF